MNENYKNYRRLKRKFEARKVTPEEWRQVAKTFTKKECDYFFYFRNEDCTVKENMSLDYVSQVNDTLGASNSALYGRWRNIEFKLLQFLDRQPSSNP